MASRSIKFIAADMDGTLLDHKGQLDPAFFDLYQQLEQRDIIFAAASGRQYYSLLDTFAPIKNQMMFVAENGTMVMHQGKELYSCTMDSDAIESIIRTVRAIEGTYLVLCGKQSAYIETEDPQALEEFAKYYARCQYVQDLLQVDDEFIKVAICHFGGTEQLVFPTVNAQFGESHKVVVSARIWLDIMHADASKGAAIKSLQQQLGFSYEQTMSFGDYFNDVEMLQASYHSYAVANAHEAVKGYARFSAPANSEGGVLQVINQLLQE
jgi:Cof subfamily protein (haloacid dehalogenase superfamily)